MTETTIQFACDGCGKRYSCPSAYAGRTTKCGKCGVALTVPVNGADDASHVSFGCELCGTRMNVPARYVGRRVKCPDCNHATAVPKPEAKRAKPRPAAMDGEQYELYEGDAQPHGVDLALASPKSISFECRVCQTHLQAPEEAIGRPITCPDCGAKTPVPKPRPQAAKPVLVDDHYEVDSTEETTATSEGLYDDYLSKPPLGFKTFVKDDERRKHRRADGIEETVTAPRWGLGLLSGFVSCFTNSKMLLTLLGLSLATLLTLPLFGVTASVFSAGGLNGWLVGFILTVCSLGVGLLYIAIGSTVYWAVLNNSAAGSRRVEEWPSIDPGTWIGPTLCILFSGVVASTPGALLAGAISQTAPQYAEPIGTLGVWILLPWVQLAQLDNDSPWGVVSSRVARTARHAPVTWLAFYLLTLGLTLASIELAELAVAMLGVWSVLVISPLFATQSVVYAWLVGRVGWAAGAATPEIDTPLT